MMKKHKHKEKDFTLLDYIKANRKASREEEIAAHGHPLPKHRVEMSKKIYSRKKKHKGTEG